MLAIRLFDEVTYFLFKFKLAIDILNHNVRKLDVNIPPKTVCLFLNLDPPVMKMLPLLLHID